MIYGTLRNAARFEKLDPMISLALRKAAEYTPDSYPSEPVILNEKVKLLPNRYETRPKEEGRVEAHRKYIDVMVMIEGEETVYVKPAEELSRITEAYDGDRDVLFAETDPDMSALTMKAGYFCILFPEDAHLPGCMTDKKSCVKKFVGKVRV